MIQECKGQHHVLRASRLCDIWNLHKKHQVRPHPVHPPPNQPYCLHRWGPSVVCVFWAIDYHGCFRQSPCIRSVPTVYLFLGHKPAYLCSQAQIPLACLGSKKVCKGWHGSPRLPFLETYPENITVHVLGIGVHVKFSLDAKHARRSLQTALTHKYHDIMMLLSSLLIPHTPAPLLLGDSTYIIEVLWISHRTGPLQNAHCRPFRPLGTSIVTKHLIPSHPRPLDPMMIMSLEAPGILNICSSYSCVLKSSRAGQPQSVS